MLYEGRKKELKRAWELGREQGRMQVSKPASAIRTMSPDDNIENFMRQYSGPKNIHKKEKEALERRDKAVKQIMKTEERLLLKYLYMEGYADSYEEAEYLLEELNDDEFEELYERTFFGKQPGRAIQTTGSSRSSGTHALSEPDLDAMRARFKQADEDEAAAKAPKQKPSTTVPSRGIAPNEPALRRRTPEGHRKRGSSPASTADKKAKQLATGHSGRTGSYSGRPTPESKERAKAIRKVLRNRANWGKPKTQAEEYVLEYLIQEGYADSYESADVILELMSDEWFEQILND